MGGVPPSFSFLPLPDLSCWLELHSGLVAHFLDRFDHIVLRHVSSKNETSLFTRRFRAFFSCHLSPHTPPLRHTLSIASLIFTSTLSIPNKEQRMIVGRIWNFIILWTSLLFLSLIFKEFKKVGECDNRYISKMLQREKMLIACNNKI